MSNYDLPNHDFFFFLCDGNGYMSIIFINNFRCYNCLSHLHRTLLFIVLSLLFKKWVGARSFHSMHMELP